MQNHSSCGIVCSRSKTNGIFHNEKLTIPPTIIKNDNSTAVGFTNKNIQLKKSKSWDMNLHWLRDRENRKEFNIIWEKGPANATDYSSKHHPTKHHRVTRTKYIRDKE